MSFRDDLKSKFETGDIITQENLYNWIDKTQPYQGEKSSFPTTGDPEVTYIATDENKIYRWNGSAYEELSGNMLNIDVIDKFLQLIAAGSTYNTPWASVDSQSDDGMCIPLVGIGSVLPVSIISSESGIGVDNTNSGATDATIYIDLMAVKDITSNPVFTTRSISIGTMAAMTQGSVYLGGSQGNNTYTISQDDKDWLSGLGSDYQFYGIVISSLQDPTSGSDPVKRIYTSANQAEVVNKDVNGGLKCAISFDDVKDGANIVGFQVFDKNNDNVYSIDLRDSFISDFYQQIFGASDIDDIMPIAVGNSFVNMAMGESPAGMSDWSITFADGTLLSFTSVGAILTVSNGNMIVDPNTGSGWGTKTGELYSATNGWTDNYNVYRSNYRFCWSQSKITAITGNPNQSNNWFRFINMQTCVALFQYIVGKIPSEKSIDDINFKSWKDYSGTNILISSVITEAKTRNAEKIYFECGDNGFIENFFSNSGTSGQGYFFSKGDSMTLIKNGNRYVGTYYTSSGGIELNECEVIFDTLDGSGNTKIILITESLNTSTSKYSAVTLMNQTISDWKTTNFIKNAKLYY